MQNPLNNPSHSNQRQDSNTNPQIPSSQESQFRPMEATLNTTEIERYPAYKDSGLGWLGELPKHWEVIRIKYLFNEKNERSNTGNEELLSLSKYHGVIPRSTLTDKVESANSLVGYKLCSKGDLILNKLQAWNGMLDISRFDGIVSPDYSVYSVVNEAKVNKHFFKYLFTTSNYISEFTKVSSGIGDGFFRLYSGAFFNIWAILPPFPEQTAIANFLDRKTAQVDTAIRIKERQIELLKERRQILIHKAVTQGLDPKVPLKDSGVEWIGEIPAHWEVVRAGKLARIVRGASPRPSGDPKYFGSNDVNWITVGDITKDELMFLNHTNEFLTNKGKELSRFLMMGTLVFTNSGATLGVPKIMNIEGCINDGVLAFLDIMKSKISTRFLYHYLNTLTEALRIKMNQGATQPNLNTDIVKQLQIPLPPLQDQEVVSTYVETIFKKTGNNISLKEKEIAKLKEYKATLINSAVTGKIKVS